MPVPSLNSLLCAPIVPSLRAQFPCACTLHRRDAAGRVVVVGGVREFRDARLEFGEHVRNVRAVVHEPLQALQQRSDLPRTKLVRLNFN